MRGPSSHLTWNDPLFKNIYSYCSCGSVKSINTSIFSNNMNQSQNVEKGISILPTEMDDGFLNLSLLFL